MQQVIFVGGTAYSGSTLADLTIGNDPAGFSCGEVVDFFNPTRPHHVNPICGCGVAQCQTWPSLRVHGEERVYESIFEMHPEVRFIVDSSKDPFWIARQSERLRRQQIPTRHILIWKTPVEIARSYQKRGHARDWQKSWVNYHRVYASLELEWRSVAYSSFVSEPSSLASVCSWLGIDYSTEKARYWEKRHCILGGNHSARVHLHDAESAEFGRSNSILRKDTGHNIALEKHRRVQLEVAANSKDDVAIDDSSPYVRPILRMLSSFDVAGTGRDVGAIREVKMSPTEVHLRRLVSRYRQYTGRRRYPPHYKS